MVTCAFYIYDLFSPTGIVLTSPHILSCTKWGNEGDRVFKP